METRLGRYFKFRRLNSEPSQPGHVLDDLEIYSIPYEQTRASAKPPIFLSQPLRKSAIAAKRMTDEFDGLAIRAISYDSLRPGKAPVVGGRPYKGNGPVKLQTSRRLSSGEFLTTTQDDQWTLEDIREGDYIVGRREKRNSQLSQVKTSSPSVAAPASPRFQDSASMATPRQSFFAEQVRQPPSPATFVHTDVSASPVLAASRRDSPPVTPRLLPPELLPLDSGYGRTPSAEEHISANAMPSKTARARMPSNAASLLSRGEEQNATIQALWKAEYGRLVAIYGQDGVDRNIADLNRDHHSLPPVMFPPLPRPPFDAGWTTNSVRNSQGSYVRESSTFEDASDYSSQKPSSIMSSEGSSSSYTKRTSVYEPDLMTTREDVRRIVENMRSNYLRAIESKARATEEAKTKHQPRVRASLPTPPAGAASTPSKQPPKTARQSWHGNNIQEPAKADRKRAKTKPAGVRLPSPMLKTSASRSSARPKASLQRADSLTLGVLVPMIPSPEKAATSESPVAGHICLPAPHALSSSVTHEAPHMTRTNQKSSVETH